jgi:integrase
VGLYLRSCKGKEKGSGWKIWWMSYSGYGKQVRESTGTQNKRLAQKMLAVRLAAVAEGRFNLPSSNPPRLKEWATKFLESVPHPNTKAGYTIGVAHLQQFFGENTKLSDISVARIEEFKQRRLAAGVGPATVNRNLSVLRRMLTLALRQRLISRNPFAEVQLLEERKHRRRPHILTWEEQNKILATAPPHLRALIILLTETGLRVKKEALALKWEDVDFRSSQLVVQDSKTIAGRRTVPLSELCKVELLRWKKFLESGCSPYVFPNLDRPGNHILCVRKTWSTTLRMASIPHFPIYYLRATFASRLGAAGVPDTFVAQMLGHSTTSILPDYEKAIDEYRRDAIRKLDELRKSKVATTNLGTPISPAVN